MANPCGSQHRLHAQGLQAGSRAYAPSLCLGPALIALGTSSETPGSQGLFPGKRGLRQGPGNRNLRPWPLS